jgi:hypothetical protein
MSSVVAEFEGWGRRFLRLQRAVISLRVSIFVSTASRSASLRSAQRRGNQL